MEFNDPTNKDGLVNDVLFLCNTVTANYSLLDITRNINQAYHDVTRLIWESSDDWQFDDSNNTDLPKAIHTLGHASASYTIPSTARKIWGVEVKDSEGTWHRLTQIDYRDISTSIEEYLSTAGLPIHYDLIGNQITLYPPPASGSVTLSDGLCVRVSRDVTEFTSGDTTAQPGFATQFHRILSLAAAIDFEKDPTQLKLFSQMKDRLEKGLQKFYGSRAIEGRPQLRPHGKRYWKQYL